MRNEDFLDFLRYIKLLSTITQFSALLNNMKWPRYSCSRLEECHHLSQEVKERNSSACNNWNRIWGWSNRFWTQERSWKSRIHMSRNGANKHLSPCCRCKGKDWCKGCKNSCEAVYWGSYSEVVPLSKEDESYRDYIRMRDDRKEALKKAKQNLLSFLLRKDRKYSVSPWTQKHLSWLKKQEFESPIDKRTIGLR